MNNIKNFLIEIGLNEKEVAVYLALLQLSKGTVLEISQKAKVKRPTTYLVLLDLLKKGIASSKQDQKSIKYFPTHPKKILTQLKNKMEMAEEILPELLNIYREREDSPSIQVFDSLEFYEYTGQLLMENLKAGEEALIYAHVNFFATQTEKTAETWFKIMRNKKYKTKILIYGDGEKEREHIRKCKATKNPNLQVRMIKNMEFPVKTEQAIFGNNIAMFTGGNKYSTILIDSENMANTFKQVFYQIWKDGEEV